MQKKLKIAFGKATFKQGRIKQRWEVEPGSVLLPGVIHEIQVVQGLEKSWALFQGNFKLQKRGETTLEMLLAVTFCANPAGKSFSTHWDVNNGKYLFQLWENCQGDPEHLELSFGWAGRRFPAGNSAELLLQKHIFPFFFSVGQAFFHLWGYQGVHVAAKGVEGWWKGGACWKLWKKINFLSKYVLCLGEIAGPERASGFNKKMFGAWVFFLFFVSGRKIQPSPLQRVFSMWGSRWEVWMPRWWAGILQGWMDISPPFPWRSEPFPQRGKGRLREQLLCQKSGGWG